MWWAIGLELIENFKNLYEQMNDEKNVLTEENEKLQNENDQFRELLQVGACGV